MVRASWQRRLPQTLVIPDVAELVTLADVRSLMRHLPPETREKHTWRYVASQLEQAANGGDVAGAVIALRLVLMLEGVECRAETRAALARVPPAPKSTTAILGI